ncbi:MAG: hypothetical protein C5B48_16565 [Candidatus Rokuibacteriota bacterium]|nr:MAG: hypothetical protein C5B48_16565 [Candidatus Rokubacteria bacterium]
MIDSSTGPKGQAQVKLGRRRLIALVVFVGAALALVAAGVGAQSSPAAPPELNRQGAARELRLLTGNVSLTASKGQCASAFTCFNCQNEVLDLDSLTVHVDVPGNRNGATFGRGCLGTVRRLVVTTVAQDAVRVSGATNMTIGGPGSSIRCNTASSQPSQDGIQVTNGSNITFTGIDVGCTSGTHGQLFINSIGNGIPDDVIFERGKLEPNPAHVNNVVIGTSIYSGVRDSTICPTRRPSPVLIRPTAVHPLNERNQTPVSCSGTG